jgi:hypothetical protein
MTHDERRLLCLVARTLAEAVEADDRPMLARELRQKVGMVQRHAAVQDSERRKAVA